MPSLLCDCTALDENQLQFSSVSQIFSFIERNASFTSWACLFCQGVLISQECACFAEIVLSARYCASLCSIDFLTFTLKLPFQTLHSVAPGMCSFLLLCVPIHDSVTNSQTSLKRSLPSVCKSVETYLTH